MKNQVQAICSWSCCLFVLVEKALGFLDTLCDEKRYLTLLQNLNLRPNYHVWLEFLLESDFLWTDVHQRMVCDIVCDHFCLSNSLRCARTNRCKWLSLSIQVCGLLIFEQIYSTFLISLLNWIALDTWCFASFVSVHQPVKQTK